MKKTLIVGIMLLAGLAYTNAADYQMVLPPELPVATDAMGNTSDMGIVMPPAMSSYSFDEKAAKDMIAQPSAIVEIKCNAKAVLATMGMTPNTMTQLLSLGMAEGKWEYNFDFRMCSLWGNRPTANYQETKSITQDQAINYAKTFLKEGNIGNKSYSMVGEPIVIARNSYGNPMPMGMADNAVSNTPAPIDGIDIDETNPKPIDQEFTHFSILFPYNIGSKGLYNKRGGRAGIMMEVNADGVISFNAQLLPFTAIRRDAQKVSGDELVKLVKAGGNQPFRGASQEVKLQAPQRIFILFSLWRNGVTELYLSSGIRFGSDVRADQRQQQNYEMIISDYKVGNTSPIY